MNRRRPSLLRSCLACLALLLLAAPATRATDSAASPIFDAQLPQGVAEKIAIRNAENLFKR